MVRELERATIFQNGDLSTPFWNVPLTISKQQSTLSTPTPPTPSLTLLQYPWRQGFGTRCNNT